MLNTNTRRHQKITRFVLLAVTALSLGMTGCNKNKKAFSVYEISAHHQLIEDQQPLGEVSVFPTNISRWEDFRTSLQPQFTLTADQALEQVLGTSMRTQQSEVTLNRLGLAAGLPGTSTTQTTDSTTNVAADGTTTLTGNDSTTTTKQPGSPPSLDGVRATPNAVAPGSFDGQSLTSDAMMRYWAAAALYQEVQLLNRIVSDATTLKGYEAYIVRLQVSTMPYSRQLALDTYLNLEINDANTPPLPMSRAETRKLILGLAESAKDQKGKSIDPLLLENTLSEIESSRVAADELKQLPGDETDKWDDTSQNFAVLKGIVQQIANNNSLSSSVRSDSLEATASLYESESEPAEKSIIPRLKKAGVKLDASDIKSLGQNVPFNVGIMWGDAAKGPDVQVVPMLVTDNLELTAAGRSASQTRDLALALQAMVQNVGVSLTAQNYRQLVQASFGQDYNSLLMVTKSGRNKLRIRLGALNSPTTRYAMVPRNHAVTFLLLVRTHGDGDGDTPIESPTEEIRITKHIECFDTLTGRSVLKMTSPKESITLTDWPSAPKQSSKFLATSSVDDGVYNLPLFSKLPDVENPPKNENATLLLADDGKVTTAKLVGGRHIDPNFVDAFLVITTKSDKKTQGSKTPDSKQIKLPNISASIDAGGSNLNLVWPSLSNIGFNPSDPLEIKVHFDRRRSLEDSDHNTNTATFTGHYHLLKPAENPKAISKMSILSNHIAFNAAGGTGKIRIKVDAKTGDGDLKIVVQNALVVSASALGATNNPEVQDGAVVLKSSNTSHQIDLELRELLPGTEVTLKLVNEQKHPSDAVKAKVIKP